MTEPVEPTITITLAEYEAVYAELGALRETAVSPEQLAALRERAAMVGPLEQQAAEANNLRAQVNDLGQERDRLRQLLLSIVPSLDTFDPDYPPATAARVAFAGETPEEIAEKMALWDVARSQKATEWSSLKNNVRTQATV